MEIWKITQSWGEKLLSYYCIVAISCQPCYILNYFLKKAGHFVIFEMIWMRIHSLCNVLQSIQTEFIIADSLFEWLCDGLTVNYQIWASIFIWIKASSDVCNSTFPSNLWQCNDWTLNWVLFKTVGKNHECLISMFKFCYSISEFNQLLCVKEHVLNYKNIQLLEV